MKNTHGRVLKVRNLTKGNTPPWASFKLLKWYQISQNITFTVCPSETQQNIWKMSEPKKQIGVQEVLAAKQSQLLWLAGQLYYLPVSLLQKLLKSDNKFCHIVH